MCWLIWDKQQSKQDLESLALKRRERCWRMGKEREDGWRLCSRRNEKWETAITSLCSIEKSSAVTFNLLNDVQILNCCNTGEMLLTDLAIVVKSNCLLQTCFSELGLYVSQWKKMGPTVITVISCFLSLKTHSLQYFLCPLPFLPPSLSLSLSYCVLSAVSPSPSALLLFRLFNLSFYPFSPALSSIIHPLHCFSSSEILFWSLPLYSIPVKTRGRSNNLFICHLCTHISWVQGQ